MAESDDDLAINVGVSMQKLNRQLARVEADFHKAAKRQENAFRKANEKAAKDFDKLRDSANRSLGGIRMPGLSGLGAGLGAALSARELVRMTDTWTDLSSRVGLAVGEMSRAPEIMSRISDMARRTYSSLESTAESYLANATTLRELGLSTEESLNYTEALNNALVVSGAKAQTAASVQDALAKALALGALRGDQLNTVIGSGGRVAELLAEELGVTVNQLRKVGAEGKITGAVIDRALRGNLLKLRAEADSMPATIGDAFQILRNAVLEYVGSADKGVDASGRIAAALILVADNIDKVVAVGGILLGRVLGPAALIVLTRMSAQFVATAAAIRGMGTAAGASAAAVTGLSAALKFVGGPIGAVLAAVALLPALMTSSAERVKSLRTAGEGAATALDDFAEASKRARQEQGSLAGEVSRATAAMLAQSRAQLQAERDLLEQRVSESRDALSGRIFSSDLDQAITALAPAEQPGANFNRYLAALGPQLRAIREGRGDVASVVREMNRLAGAGKEVSDLLEEIERRIAAGETGAALREATEELVQQARAIGGFDKELEAFLKAPAGSRQATDAFRSLQAAMRDAAQAGDVLRRGLFDNESGLRSKLGRLGSAEAALEAIKEALKGNWEEAQRIMQLANPFATTTSGARDAASAVQSLASAYKQYAETRRQGQEWANSRGGFEASYVAERARGAGSQTEELVRSVTALAEQMGVSARDLLAVMSFETGGRLRPDVMGPVTKNGQHFGLIQFGDKGAGPRYGVTPQSSITEQVIAAGRYLQDAGVKAGDSLANIYAAVLSGDSRKIYASDLAAGGVVANVSEAVSGDQFAAHLARAEGILAAYGGTVQEVVEAEKDAAQAQKDRVAEAEQALKLRGDLVAQAQQQVADAAFELTLIGKTAAEQARLRTQYLLTNEAKANGIDLNERLAGSEKTYGQVIAEQAAQIGEYVAQQERRAQAAQNAAEREQFMVQVQDDLKNGLLDAIVAGNSFADVLKNVAQMLAKAALQAALFGDGPFGGGGGGLLGNLVRGFLGGIGGDPLAGALRGAGVAGVRSFDGGGYTWDGPRTGGIDGKGGRIAILHPKETVIDHTRGGGMQDINVRVGIDRNGNLQAFVDRRADAIAQHRVQQSDSKFVGRFARTQDQMQKRTNLA